MALVLALPVLLAACAPRPIGYGVLLWAPKESALQTGELIRIMKESKAQGSYYFQAPDGKKLQETPAWRVRFFQDPQQAEIFRGQYARELALFGFAMKDALPIREKPDPVSRRIYMLREGQLVKVVGRGETPETIGAYQSYWYRVLTEDGYEGYCFGQFLRPFVSEGSPEEEVARLMSQDLVLDRLLAAVWRPEYFLDMMNKGRIDLLKFRPDVGLFPEPAQGRIRLVTPAYALTFDYKSVEKVGAGRYVFGDTELRISMTSDDRIVVSYPVKGRQVSGVYYQVKEDIEQEILKERERREAVYRGLTSRGTLLRSTGYGNIELQEGMRFSWTGLGSLASRLGLPDAQGSGSIDFPYYLTRELGARYHGVITLRFDGVPEDRAASFLYILEGQGIRLVLLRAEDVVDQEAVRTGLSPQILFFTFSGS
jgi:DNA-directed RNA polymerase subunit H (RpoH/RPB5)